MVTNDRRPRARSFRLEALEGRQLLSLIDAKPTLRVLNGPGVHVLRSGAVYIVNPTQIRVQGTAQSGTATTNVTVGIFAEDRAGDLVNGGQPLAVVSPDFLGRYHATISLPSTIRKDVNFLVAREEAVGTQVSQITLNGTTVSGLSGNIQLNPGSVSGLSGSIATPILGISGISGSISDPANTLTGLTGSISTPSNTLTGLTGSISNPSTSLTGLTGDINTTGGSLSAVGGSLSLDTFPITVGATSGTGGPATGSFAGLTGTIGASSGTLSAGTGTIGASTSALTGGTGTIGASTSALTGGTGTIGASTSTLSGGTGTLAAGTSGFAQSGSATLSALTGTFSGGTGIIAPTIGTSTQVVDDIAVSDPLTIAIHQSRNQRLFVVTPDPVPAPLGPAALRAMIRAARKAR